jgi:hypothetical protein
MAGRGRPKGSPKPEGSGRKIGSVNLAPTVPAIKETVAEAFLRLNFDPIAELVKLMPQLSPDSRAKTIVAVMPYIAAPMKAPEAPQQPAFQVFANVDRAALLQAVNAPPPLEVTDGSED